MVIASGCLHGVLNLNGAIAGLEAEHYEYYFKLFGAFMHFSPRQIETLTLDMICQLGPSFQKLSKHPKFTEMFSMAVGAFHARGHDSKCFAANSAQMLVGGGWETREFEEEWEEVQSRVGNSLPYMSSDRYKDMLQLCIFEMNSEKRCGIFELLVSRWKHVRALDYTLSLKQSQLQAEAVELLQVGNSEGPLALVEGAGAGAGAGAVNATALEKLVRALALLNEQAEALTVRDLNGHRMPTAAADSDSSSDKLHRWVIAMLECRVAQTAVMSDEAVMLFGQGGGGRNTSAISKASAAWSSATHLASAQLADRRLELGDAMTGTSKTWLQATYEELRREPRFKEIAVGAIKEKVVVFEADIYSSVSEYSYVNSEIQNKKLKPEEVNNYK